jgi:hypothetical protein
VRDTVQKTAGHKILVPTAAEHASWEAAGKEVIESWAKRTKNGTAVLEAFKKGAAGNGASR